MFKSRWVRVAFATRNRTQVNVGFEHATEIAVYEVSSTEAREVDVLTFRVSAADASGAAAGQGRGGKCGQGCGGGKRHEESINEPEIIEKVDSLVGVSVLIVNETLHAFSALELNHARVFTIKVDNPENICDVIARLQEMLRGEPPLWLRRVLIGTDAVVEV